MFMTSVSIIVPSTTPHGYERPLIDLPPTSTMLLLPTTANGMLLYTACQQHEQVGSTLWKSNTNLRANMAHELVGVLTVMLRFKLWVSSSSSSSMIGRNTFSSASRQYTNTQGHICQCRNTRTTCASAGRTDEGVQSTASKPLKDNTQAYAWVETQN